MQINIVYKIRVIGNFIQYHALYIIILYIYITRRNIQKPLDRNCNISASQPTSNAHRYIPVRLFVCAIRLSFIASFVWCIFRGTLLYQYLCTTVFFTQARNSVCGVQK